MRTESRSLLSREIVLRISRAELHFIILHFLMSGIS